MSAYSSGSVPNSQTKMEVILTRALVPLDIVGSATKLAIAISDFFKTCVNVNACKRAIIRARWARGMEFEIKGLMWRKSYKEVSLISNGHCFTVTSENNIFVDDNHYHLEDGKLVEVVDEDLEEDFEEVLTSTGTA